MAWMMDCCEMSAPRSSATFRPSRSTTTRELPSTSSSSSDEIISTPSPVPASSLISAWISALAPMSMPRVGSSRMSSAGFMHSQRASSTFCWLPPDSSRIFCSAPVALMPSRFMNRSTISRCFARSTMPARVSVGSAASVRFSRTDSSGMIPSPLRSSDTKAIPARMASSGVRGFSRFPSICMAPSSGGSAPKMARAVSVRPEPSSPATPRISPLRTSSVTPRSFWPRRSPSVRSSGAVPSASAWWPANPVVPCRSSSRALPSIRQTRSSRSSSARRWVPTSLPSRSTVTRSHTAYSSSKRWLM